MREILFKAKAKNNGEWVNGVPIQCYDGDWQICTNAYKITISPETVCQFTGLTDKKGNKIFEGDIMQAHLDDEFPDDIATVEIVWLDNGFYIKEGNCFDALDDKYSKYFEIVGNIFDNPELLKEGKE